MSNIIIRTYTCHVCDSRKYKDDFPEGFNDELAPRACNDCEEKYPPALIKATCDLFDYAAKLVGGEVVRFRQASIHGQWVTLYGYSDEPIVGLAFPCPRGVDVQLAHIVWVADAPHGS